MSDDEKDKTENGGDTIVLKGHWILPLLLLGLAILIFLATGIDWTVFEVGHPMFSTGGNDFKDVDKLVEKLESSDKKDPVSQFVWGQFSKETQEALSLDPLPPQLQEKLLVPELNKILESDFSIYSDQLFPKDLSGYGLEVLPDADENAIPDKGKSKVIVAKVDDKFKFRIFDSEGGQGRL